MKKVALAVALTAGVLLAAWLSLPAHASVEGCGCKLDSRPKVSFRANKLTLSFDGHFREGVVDELLALTPSFESRGVRLSARLQLVAPIEPGIYRIEGVASGTDETYWTFTPSPGHDAKVKGAGVLLTAARGSSPSAEQRLSGTLTINTASETELRGKLDLTALGEFSARAGKAQVSTPFSIKLGSRTDEAPNDY